MADVLICKQCGGPLNEDYVCTYCGTRYQKPQQPTVTINVTNNYNAPTQQPQPEPAKEEEVQAQKPPSEQVPVQEASEPEPEVEVPKNEEESPKQSSLEEFVNNSFFLLFLMLVGSGALIVFGVKSDNEVMIIIGAIVGVIFLILSSKYHSGKDGKE